MWHKGGFYKCFGLTGDWCVFGIEVLNYDQLQEVCGKKHVEKPEEVKTMDQLQRSVGDE